MRAAFIGEGTSDSGLMTVLRRLCRKLRVSEIEIESVRPLLEDRKSGAEVAAKMRTLARYGGEYDVLFVHRDSDKAGVEARQQEIDVAQERCAAPWTVVPVIPIQETEAWLLVDADAIRRAAGNPRGREDLGMPPLGQIEDRAFPKEILREALRRATKPGRQRAQAKQNFKKQRQQLLETLDIDGPVTQLSAWQRLERDITDKLDHYIAPLDRS